MFFFLSRCFHDYDGTFLVIDKSISSNDFWLDVFEFVLSVLLGYPSKSHGNMSWPIA